MGNNDRGQTFLKGALVLAISSLIVKVIGMFLKIPLYELIGKEGMGLFNVSYQIYTFMFIISTAGFPIAVSKMVAESMARENEREAKRVFETAFLLLGIIGIIGSTVLFVYAESLAGLLGSRNSALGIKAIAPAIFFVSLVSSYRGYFQGRQNMYPTAFSEVIEASAKLVVGIILAVFIMKLTVNNGLKTTIDIVSRQVQSLELRTQFASAGAILGVTSGTFLSLALMVAIYAFTKRRKTLNAIEDHLKKRRTILKELVMIAIPITIGASVSSLTSLIDLATVMNRLVVNPSVFDRYDFLFAPGTAFAQMAAEKSRAVGEILEMKANALYGMYTGQAQTMFNLPLTLVVALSMSAVPAISSAVAKGSYEQSKRLTESVIRIAMLFALPCAIGMSVMSKQILGLLFNDSDSHIILQKLAIAVVFVSVVSVTNAILQAYGKVYYPVVHMVIGGLAKVIMNYFCIPIWGIDGAPIATNVCYAVIAVLNIISIIRIVHIKFSITDFVVRPLVAALIMGVSIVFVYDFISRFIGSVRIATLLTICVAGVVYLVAALLTKAIKRYDITMLPKGEKITEFLDRLRLLPRN